MVTTKAQREAALPIGLTELHCANPECGKFLGYVRLGEGLISIKCHRCKTTNLPFSLSESASPRTAREVYCDNCGRFLFLNALSSGAVNVKCRVCHQWKLDSTETDARIGIEGQKPRGPRQARGQAPVEISST